MRSKLFGQQRLVYDRCFAHCGHLRLWNYWSSLALSRCSSASFCRHSIRPGAPPDTVACLSNLRSIGQALTIYVSENNGYLPGSGDTTGYSLISKNAVGTLINPTGVNISNIPGNVIQPEDWIGPLAARNGAFPADD